MWKTTIFCKSLLLRYHKQGRLYVKINERYSNCSDCYSEMISLPRCNQFLLKLQVLESTYRSVFSVPNIQLLVRVNKFQFCLLNQGDRNVTIFLVLIFL